MNARTVLAWLVAAAVVAGVGVVAWIGGLAPLSGGRSGVAAASLAAAWAVTGALLVTARPGNAVGWLLILSGVLQGWSNFSSAYSRYGLTEADPAWPAASWVAQSGSMAYFPSLILPVTVVLAVYPDGRLPSRHWRLPFAAVVVGLSMVTLLATLDGSAYNDFVPGEPPFALPGGWWTTVLIAAAFGLLILGTLAIWVMTGFRLARSQPPLRPQLAWYVAAIPLFLIGVLGPGWLIIAFGLLFPIAIAIGVLRYRMLDIVLRPAIVYGLLTLIVIAVYVGVTALAGSALDRGPLPGVVAAALVAVGLTPARERLQRGADRFVYGERRDPLLAVAALGDRVAQAEDAGLLAAAVATTADAVRSPGAQALDRAGLPVATFGELTEPATTLPLVVAGEQVGTLRVSPRVTGSRFSAADRRVLAALAPQVAVVMHALGLADALQVQRDRVVAATHDERDRLQRELHDGLGPALTGTALGLQATADALAGDRTEQALNLVNRMQAEVGTAVAEVRRVIDGLRPAELDADGLDLAVRRRAAALAPGLDVAVAVGELPPIPLEVEAAAYRIAGEALTNVARHADAHSAEVAVTAEDGELLVRVADDGKGIDDTALAGVGVTSMKRRAEALGGTLDVDTGSDGTTVTARIPL